MSTSVSECFAFTWEVHYLNSSISTFASIFFSSTSRRTSSMLSVIAFNALQCLSIASWRFNSDSVCSLHHNCELLQFYFQLRGSSFRFYRYIIPSEVPLVNNVRVFQRLCFLSYLLAFNSITWSHSLLPSSQQKFQPAVVSMIKFDPCNSDTVTNFWRSHLQQIHQLSRIKRYFNDL